MRHSYRAVALALLVALAGCSGFVPGEDSGEAKTGTVGMYLSDQPNDIDDFEHLNVTITKVGLHRQAENESGEGSWLNESVDSQTVDLTRLQGDNATLLGNLTVPAGNYTKVFVYVSEVNGTLTSGESATVKLPSNKLQLSKPFTVEPNETVSFVYDVTVQQTGSGKYILKPQAGQSGTDKSINRVGKQGGERGEERGGEQNRTTGQPQGSVAMLLSDRPNAIDDFEHLNVTITKIGLHKKAEDSGNETAENETENESTRKEGWLTYDVDARSADLTRLKGDNATLLGNLSVPAGNYTKVFIYVSEVNGTLTDGSHPEVKLPSQKLQLSKHFTVEANESVSFVYDVGVHETGSGKYIIKPQVGESGPDKPVKRVDERKRGGDGKRGGEGGNQTTTTTTTTTQSTTTTTEQNTTTTTTAETTTASES